MHRDRNRLERRGVRITQCSVAMGTRDNKLNEFAPPLIPGTPCRCRGEGKETRMASMRNHLLGGNGPVIPHGSDDSALRRMNGKFPWSLTVVLSLIISSVRGQCTNGNEAECVWTHDENAPLRWTSKTDGVSESWVEVNGCEPSQCGSAVLQSPWLPPTDREATWMLRYKIYGINTVQLELSVRTENSGPRQIFFKKGNYAHKFPEFWTANKVTLPAISARHRLRLEAVTPYDKALVAVSNIRTEDMTSHNLPAETASRTAAFYAPTVPPARRTHQEPIEPDTRTVEPTSITHEAPLKPDIQTDSDDGNEESQSEDRLEALEAGFIGGHPDLRKGYTIVMDPNICMYP